MIYINLIIFYIIILILIYNIYNDSYNMIVYLGRIPNKL